MIEKRIVWTASQLEETNKLRNEFVARATSAIPGAAVACLVNYLLMLSVGAMLENNSGKEGSGEACSAWVELRGRLFEGFKREFNLTPTGDHIIQVLSLVVAVPEFLAEAIRRDRMGYEGSLRGTVSA